ncbi:MAG: LEA type 2 family protein [Myxococcota bacterium]
MKRIVVAALSLTVLSGCALLQEFLRAAAKSFQQPNFTFRNVALTDISLGGLNLDTVWDLNNPNNVGLSLASVDYALFIENKQVVAGAPPNGMQIGANSTSQLHFPAGIKFADIAQVVEVFLTRENATWRAEGGLGVQTPIGVIRLPIAKDGVFEVPKVPEVVFGNPRVTNLSFNGATVEFPLTVTNKNTYALPISGLTGNLAIAGSNVGTLSTGGFGDMSGKGAKQVTLPLNINFLSAAGAAVNAIRGGNAQVTFNAQLQSGQQSVPLQVNQLLTFVR